MLPPSALPIPEGGSRGAEPQAKNGGHFLLRWCTIARRKDPKLVDVNYLQADHGHGALPLLPDRAVDVPVHDRHAAERAV